MTTKNWVPNGPPDTGNIVLNELDEEGNPRGFYLSYRENDYGQAYSILDSDSPETAIVILDGKGPGIPRFLIYRDDCREELEQLYPDLEKLKEHWKEFGGHFWSDSLED